MIDDILEYRHKWRGIPYSWTGQVIIIKDFIFSINKFSAILPGLLGKLNSFILKYGKNKDI